MQDISFCCLLVLPLLLPLLRCCVAVLRKMMLSHDPQKQKSDEIFAVVAVVVAVAEIQ